MTLKKYIHDYAKKNRISIKKIAENANMPRSSLYNIMDDTKSATIINLTKLAVAMQVHPYYLIKLEWQNKINSDNFAQAIKPLQEPETFFSSDKDSSHFIAETIADGSVILTGEKFVKTWKLQNTGNEDWVNRFLVCQNPQSSSQEANLEATTNPSFAHLANKKLFIQPTVSKVAIPETKCGDTVELSVEFTAPDVPAMAFSYWKMVDTEGKQCFPEHTGVYVQVQVVSLEGAEE